MANCKSFDAIHTLPLQLRDRPLSRVGGPTRFLHQLLHVVLQREDNHPKIPTHSKLCHRRYECSTYHGKTQNECAQLCNGNSRCQSFDWRPYSGYNCALNSVKCPHRQCSSSDVGGWDGNGPWDYFGKTH